MWPARSRPQKNGIKACCCIGVILSLNLGRIAIIPTTWCKRDMASKTNLLATLLMPSKI